MNLAAFKGVNCSNPVCPFIIVRRVGSDLNSFFRTSKVSNLSLFKKCKTVKEICTCHVKYTCRKQVCQKYFFLLIYDFIIGIWCIPICICMAKNTKFTTVRIFPVDELSSSLCMSVNFAAYWYFSMSVVSISHSSKYSSKGSSALLTDLIGATISRKLFSIRIIGFFHCQSHHCSPN